MFFFPPQIGKLSFLHVLFNRRYHLWEASVYKLENGTIASNWEKKKKKNSLKWRSNRIAQHFFLLVSITSDVQFAFSHEFSSENKKNPFFFSSLFAIDKKRDPNWAKKVSCNVSSFNLLIYGLLPLAFSVCMLANQ